MKELGANLIGWASANPDFAMVILSVMTVVATASLVLWRQLYALITFAMDRYYNRLQVCVISDLKAARLDDFFDLYHRIFSSEERPATTEIQDWLRSKARQVGVQYRLYLALHRSAPSGVAISMYEESSGTLFVPYMGIAGLDAQWGDTRRIVRSLLRCVTKTARNWKFAVVEVADPAEDGLSPDEVKRRCARIRRLRALAAGVGLEMMQPDFQYVQPAYQTDVDQFDGTPMLLFLLDRRSHEELPRDVILSALRFIYLKVYKPSFRGTPAEVEAYSLELHAQLDKLQQDVSELIPVRARL